MNGLIAGLGHQPQPFQGDKRSKKNIGIEIAIGIGIEAIYDASSIQCMGCE